MRFVQADFNDRIIAPNDLARGPINPASVLSIISCVGTKHATSLPSCVGGVVDMYQDMHVVRHHDVRVDGDTWEMAWNPFNAIDYDTSHFGQFHHPLSYFSE